MAVAGKKGRIRKCTVGEDEHGNREGEEKGQIENGTLVSIELENWMNIRGPTKYCFNSGINVITGLNGSGKSSVACGIAISLGYDTHILARGHYLSSYIRNGSVSCRLVIAVRNKSELENRCVSEIERVITIVESSKTNRPNSQPEIRSSWKLNGRKCLERDISALRKDLNIQLDNMVAFLAQQRVSQFASQSPREIFIDTLRIISNGSLKSKHSQNECTGVEIALSGSEFEENDLLGVYYKFLDIFKDTKESRLRLKDNETRLSQLSKEISKSKENEIKYIQYLLHKMGIYLVHFFQSLNDVAKDKSSLESLNEMKKGVLRGLTSAKRELRMKETELSKVGTELELAKRRNEDFLKKIQLEKLDKRYKSIASNLEEIVGKLQENYRDPSVLLERYRTKIRGIEGKITDTENKIRYYKYQLENEWIPKLVRCKLYDEEQPQKFDVLAAEKKKRLLGEGVSEMSSKTITIQRRIKEFEFTLSKLVQKKSSVMQSCHSESLKEKILREKYLKGVNPKVLSNSKRENILKYFEKIHECSSEFENYLPRKKVIGPIGSYISLNNTKFQTLVETFLQQFHYYFVSEREDVKLLTERYRLNVLTLSNSKTPICPKLDDELRAIGITGFLHEHLEFEDESMKNILYQISAQFFTCVIIDNPLLAEGVQEDEILYKLSDWFKRKYDQPGNKVSNNVHLFIATQGAEDDVSSKTGILYKLTTSMYDSSSRTISMVNLGERMNTILFRSDLVKEEVTSSVPEMDQKKSRLDLEIDQLESKIKGSTKDLEEMREQYNGEIRLLNMISECLTDVPSLFGKISALEKQLEALRSDLKQSTPDEEAIKLKNQKMIQSAFMGSAPRDPLEFGAFKTGMIEELTQLKKLLVEISTADFQKERELREKFSELNTSFSSIQREISKRNDDIRHLEAKIIQINEDYDKILSTLDTKRKASIDSYLHYYSTYCQYHKRLKFNNGSDEKIYEFIYNKANKVDDNHQSQDHDDTSIKNVPGVELFSMIISGNRRRSSSSRGIVDTGLIPSYCLEMISQVSSEFGLLKCENTRLEEILNSTLGGSLSFRSSGARASLNEEEEEEEGMKEKTGGEGLEHGAGSGRRVERIPTLFEVLLDNNEYKSKYNDLFSLITSLEAKTHNTNLERMADLEQEFEILSRESQGLAGRIELYEDFVGRHYKKWLGRLELIENVVSHCFGVFMRFINDRHNGKILIPFISNFVFFINTMMDEADNKAIFNFFVDHFENDSKLNIMVRFSPDEDLRLFSSSSISGGEQSLCTILFILSLQVSESKRMT